MSFIELLSSLIYRTEAFHQYGFLELKIQRSSIICKGNDIEVFIVVYVETVDFRGPFSKSKYENYANEVNRMLTKWKRNRERKLEMYVLLMENKMYPQKVK